MSLIHDPSAIRYASTQQAYGQTWTLSKTEEDGTQVWKNGQEQEAFVPKMVETVRAEVTDWVFDGKEDTIHFDLERVTTIQYSPVDRAIAMKRAALTGSITAANNLMPGQKLQAYADSDAEISRKLNERGFFVDWNKLNDK